MEIMLIDERSLSSCKPLFAPENAVVRTGIIAPAMPLYSVTDTGKAVISVRGVMMNETPYWAPYATSYKRLAEAIFAAENDSSVQELALDINSGGGQVFGLAAVADVLAECKKRKYAYTSYCCSAAYWLASQCDKIVVEENAIVGSIGTMQIIEDWSKAFENAGITVNVIKSGKLKGTGVFGTKVTDEMIASIQAEIDGLTKNFKAAVMRGRGYDEEQMNELATGGCWCAEDAKRLGLVDVIDNRLINMLENEQEGISVMNQEQIDKAVADAKDAGVTEGKEIGIKEAKTVLQEMLAAFPDNVSFALEQFNTGSSIMEAKAAYADVLAEEVKSLKESLAAKQETVVAETETTTKAEAEDTGEEPITKGSAEAASVNFDDVIAEIKESKKCTMVQAIKMAAEKYPEAYKKYQIGA